VQLKVEGRVIQRVPGSGQTESRTMCRNIKTLYNFEPTVTDDEIRAAALQFVRKITGFNKPSAANKEAFDRAVDEVTTVSSRLLMSLVTKAAPKKRQV